MSATLNRFRVLAIVTAVLFAVPASAPASIIGFGDFSPFMINQTDGASAPTVAIAPNPLDSGIHLTSMSGSERRSIFAKVPQDITHFTASFTYQVPSSSGQTAFGTAFVIQNSPAGAGAIGGSYDGLGYLGIGRSIAVSLESASASGLYTNGSVSGGSTSLAPLNLLSGHVFDVNVSYNGSLLHESISDETTAASYSATFPLNLASIVSGSTAFVGLTATTNSGADQYFSKFNFANVPEPSAFLTMLIGSVGAVTWRRRVARKPTKLRSM